jgi:hypothetical protein
MFTLSAGEESSGRGYEDNGAMLSVARPPLRD